MASSIDETFPVSGVDQSSQGFRDNFSAAKTEIEALQTDVATKESAITAGTTSEYYRGDKTFQTLDKTAVGLSNVDNTSDTSKPVSTAQQTALTAKANLAGGNTFTGHNTFGPTSGTWQPVSFATTYVADADKQFQSFTATDDFIIDSVINGGNAQAVYLAITQGGAGGWLLARNSTNIKLDGGTLPALSTSAGAIDILVLLRLPDGNWLLSMFAKGVA